MSRGRSGRIVIEINPEIKDLLYEALVRKKLTLKDWFLHQCDNYLSSVYQPSLFTNSENEMGNKGSQNE